LNDTETETRDTNQQWENLKRAITTAAKKTLVNLKQQPRKPWMSEKNINLVEQRRKNKHDKNKSEYTRLRKLINRKAKKDKEEWLGQYCEELENQLNLGKNEKSYNLINGFLENPKCRVLLLNQRTKNSYRRRRNSRQMVTKCWRVIRIRRA
jgi:hypothetical protein